MTLIHLHYPPDSIEQIATFLDYDAGPFVVVTLDETGLWTQINHADDLPSALDWARRAAAHWDRPADQTYLYAPNAAGPIPVDSPPKHRAAEAARWA